MGHIFSSYPLVDIQMAAPRNVVDSNKVGDVYLVRVNPRESPDVAGDKRTHWIVVIDVAGESTDEELMCVLIVAPFFCQGLNRSGWQFHLGADPASREVEFLNSRFRYKHDTEFITSVTLVGHIKNEFHANLPDLWVPGLVSAITQWYHEFTDDGKEIWSSKVNCQTFAREVIQRLGLSFPEDVQFFGNVEPWLVDLGIFVQSVAKSKYNQ